MVWAAPIVALLTVPAATLLGIDLSSEPQQLAVLYGMALLGTWTTLIPNKFIESRKVDGTNRRLIAMAAGLLLGAIGLALGRMLKLDFEPQTAFFDNSRNLSPVYFGALYAVMGGWSSLVVRDRVTRFRFLPIVVTGLVGGCTYSVLAVHATRRYRRRRLDRRRRSIGEPLERGCFALHTFRSCLRKAKTQRPGRVDSGKVSESSKGVQTPRVCGNSVWVFTCR